MGITKSTGVKIIIEHGNTKREINGPFNICGSKQDLNDLKEQLERALQDDFNYGWVEIVEYIKCDTIANTPPQKWE